MFLQKSFGVLLALGLYAVDVHAHGNHARRNHHHHHDALKRQESASESVCSTCSTSTVSNWVPYDQAVFQTSTVTAWTTQMVVVGTNPTTTVTTTLSNDPAATGSPAKKEKRQLGAGYAMTYTPYDESSGACLDAASVLAQLQEIQSLGFHHIRLYGVDCDQLTTAADQAVQLGFTITLGVYIDATGTVRGFSDLDTMIAWGTGNWPSNIAHINIGNEAVNSGFLSAAELIAFIGEATTELRAAGYTGSISCADTVNIWQDYPELCDAVTNTVHTNIQPYYNGGSSADAGSFLVSQAGIVQSACSGQSVIVSEAGWPSAGGSNGEADATSEDQETAMTGIWEATNGQVTFFSYGNDLWKAPGTEQNFGLAQLF